MDLALEPWWCCSDEINLCDIIIAVLGSESLYDINKLKVMIVVSLVMMTEKLNYINSIDLIPLLDTHGESIMGDLLGVLLMLVTNSNYLLSFINVLSGTC